ncbi:MAG: sigma 54-interacting transcriptional regulator [Deltaproteobacteria bacterium]|nr:sigma 54-interacting transcriptional regulator [Deltaproteobacteria bacterium]
MHTIACRFKERVECYRTADGLLPLPEPTARATGAQAVVAVGAQALLVSADAALTLVAGEPAPCSVEPAGASLTWTPPSPLGPKRLGAEPTRGDCDPSARATLALVLDSGEALALCDAVVLVGRHPACNVRLFDPKVSAIHCVLIRDLHGVRIVDLQSKNGTSVNGTRIKDAVLDRPATLKLGDTQLWLRSAAQIQTRAPLASPQMRALAEVIRRVAPADAPVLIQGESGAGKDGVALDLHEASSRVGRLVVLNAATISPALAASELFGHVKGSFTGADTDRQGAFAAAHHGTLFIDEVAELPLSVQAELLRAVEQKAVRRLGDHRELPVDVRLVVATHRDLAAAVRTGAFREDLYHRLSVIPILVPPLRDRPDDIVTLAEHFLARESPPRALGAAALEAVLANPWPGNVRQLCNTLRRACLLSDRLVLEPRDLDMRAPASMANSPGIVHDAVIAAYSRHDGDIGAIAAALRIHRATVFRHLKRARDAGRLPPAAKGALRRRRDTQAA